MQIEKLKNNFAKRKITILGHDNIDVDASPIIYGGELKKLGDDFLKLTAEVASGRQTKAESLGFTEMAIARVCNFV